MTASHGAARSVEPEGAETTAQVLVLWDAPSEYQPIPGTRAIRWRGYTESGGVPSVLRYVDARGEQLRARYLAWIHDLGESRFGGRRLVDRLARPDGLSYWWLTRLVEKSPYTAPLADALRLMALEEILAAAPPGKLRLVSSSRTLHESVEGLCAELGIAYEWRRAPRRGAAPSLRSLYRALPPAIRAAVTLARYLRERWSLRRAPRPGWSGSDRALFVCAPFFGVLAAESAKGRFHSRYWEGLHGMVRKLGLSMNWLHLYLPHDPVRNARIAMDWTDRFNGRSDQEGAHGFLESHLTWQVIGRVARGWLRLQWTAWRLGDVRSAFRLEGSRLTLWPVMRSDWRESITGPSAITNLLFAELLDAAVRRLPHQRQGLYVCENQPWERALIHAWRKHRHGRLIGVVHATVRFWDLRYFSDARTLGSRDSHPMPQPDLFALNGEVALAAFRDAGYPAERLAETEAQRYEYLLATRPGGVTRAGGRKVLVLGDVMAAATGRLLGLLEESAPRCPADYTYAIKPHPNCLVRADEYPSLRLSVVHNPLSELFADYDVAYASGSTSAAVDAYLAGLPVVVMLDDTELNLSPLRGYPAVRFVSTPEELAEALQVGRPDGTSSALPGSRGFFHLDSRLPRWERLLSAASGAATAQ